MVAQTFGARTPPAASSSSSTTSREKLVVTSRLYSTEPEPTVGMFIPGINFFAAQARTRPDLHPQRGAGEGFRTNVGVFNTGGQPVTVTFRIHDSSARRSART